MSDDIITAENQKMKKARPLRFGGFVFFLSLLACLSCGQKEKVIQRDVIEIPGKELELKNPALYKTRTREGRETTYLSTDFAAVPKPGSLDEFRQYFHLPPVRQYNTGTCWCFATTSLLESELKRLTFLTHKDAVAELLQKFEAR